ncbi:hypothetical protein M011DRAFT_464419 [Sporormia fimetaria CBS 119925]|uniref:Uncharacterized protein n=1 Tax=Sporormia fimetaria CBS 119925 TaxID=1340428 RepID=A0A6A6VJ40_9PLEO|nr:hypothetical protein M011DRAFT_464419 [Sporormia fimetaria CBS 119925]
MYLLSKRDHPKGYCIVEEDGEAECYEYGWWDSEKGTIVKWSLLAFFFILITTWFLGGYFHAKRRMRAGKPLLGYHRWLVSNAERRKYGQAPQEHFTFYNTQQPPYPYHPNPQNNGTYAEPPPSYYYAGGPQHPGAPKPQENNSYPMQNVAPQGYPMAPQQSGVVHAGSARDAEAQEQGPALPQRPQQAKTGIAGLIGKFRR